MQGYLSRDGMPPADLLASGRAEVSGYGVEIVEGTPPRAPDAVLAVVSAVAGLFYAARLSSVRGDSGLGFELDINSGYRDPSHNADVGGVPDSEHTYDPAEGADIVCLRSVTRYKMLKILFCFRQFFFIQPYQVG